MAPPQANVPAATYRLQLNREQTFADARALVDYLDALGITHLYVSPVSQARPGSTHGYDVVDPTRVNAELGGRRGLERLAAGLRSRGMGLVIDTVPNHMAIAPENRWWQDVLRRGCASPYARFFDIDWRRSKEGDLVYRRFFNIDDLVGVRVEDAKVFDETQRLAIELVRDGIASGLRIDHIDGLRDPLAYLRKLRRRAGTTIFLLVEKVLTGDEPLPEDWPVAGTTGYDFTNIINGLFVDPGGLQKLDEMYRRLAHDDALLAEVTYDSKRYVMRELFAREMDALADELCALAQHDAPSLRLAQEEAREAIENVIAALGVYRTYTRGAPVAERDLRYIERALRRARRRNERVRGATFRFLRRVLLLRIDDPRRRSDWLRFVLRWQQYTGPATAKGVEDTALYRYNRLISLNEVGADPEAPGSLSIARFHEAMRDRLARWPHTMNATATHDTKRGEDARMRIDALSELPDEWSRLVRRWSRANRALKKRVEGRVAPDANEELLIYQALIGAWPAVERELDSLPERFELYLRKALREAKRNATWLAPNEAYEAAVLSFAQALLRDDTFLSDFVPFQRKVARLGATNSLSQLAIKLGAPGLPDFYQGAELWDLSLVDPDNRRPVDFALRRRMLEGLDRRAARDRVALVQELLERWEDGAIKMYVTAQALRFRRERQALFARGEYVPLHATGRARDHVVAFARRAGTQWALVAAPRLAGPIAHDGFPVGEAWGDGTLRLPREAPSRWRNVLTGEEIAAHRHALPLRDVFAHLAVALLSDA